MARQATMRRSPAQQRHVNVESLPAPVGGWNARDSLANMDPMDAVTLQNWWPNVSNVELRGGYTQFATGLPGQVQTIMVYNGGNTSEIWCFTDNGSLYNITGGGVAPAPTLTGLANGIWEYTNISNAGGNFMVAVNGSDHMLLYDGSAWSSITAISSPISITGVDTSLLCNVILFKHRLWFIEQFTLRLWYLPTDSLGGAAQVFDLGGVAMRGGHLVDLDTWTIDAGYGVDDNVVFITSVGDIIIYAGTDPASITTFSLIGVWELGSAIGTRCALKWGGDLLILTFDGLLPMASALQSSRLDPRVALSDKIQGAIATATTAFAGSHFAFGWQIIYSAKANSLMINVPVGVDMQQQYAMNTITKSWAQFTGWAANCWETFMDDPYFGANGYVGKAWDDSMSDNGTSIQTFALQAFNYFQERGVKKRFIRARPSIFTDGSPAVSIGMATDFQLADTSAALTFLPTSAGKWDSAMWDVDVWGSGVVITNTWQGVTGIGYCGGVQLKTASQGTQIQWASTDINYELGGAGQ
jgi:hypothetical protein